MTHRTTARHGLAGAAMLGLLGARGERDRKPAPRDGRAVAPAEQHRSQQRGDAGRP